MVDVSVAPDGSGTVTCADGTTHTASLVIGADGVRSRVREAIRRQDESADQPLLEKPFDVFYRTVWASFPRGEGQPVPGGNYENRGEGRTTMYLTGPDKAWIFLIERIQRERSEDTKRYDDKDTASVASTFADSTLAPDLSVRDVLALPGCLTGMTDLSEGIVPVGQAASGPLVLVGDAWHAYTPNAGLGFNAGAQDVIWLANRLASHWKGGDGDKKTLAEAVDGYDQARRPAVAADLARSALTTRIGARDGWLHRFLGDWVLWFPFVQRLLAGWTVSPQVKTGLVLEYVAGEERVVGAVPWDHGIPGR